MRYQTDFIPKVQGSKLKFTLFYLLQFTFSCESGIAQVIAIIGYKNQRKFKKNLFTPL